MTRKNDESSTVPAVFFKSPIGIARYPRTSVPDTRFNAAGVYSVGLVLNPEEIEAAEERFRAIFDTAFPGGPKDITLPIRHDPEGGSYIMAKSGYAPKVLDAARQPVETVEHGARARIICRARPFNTFVAQGVALYLTAVDVQPLDTKAPASREEVFVVDGVEVPF